MKLLKLIKDASHLIRRDIVFAGSLYLEWYLYNSY